MYEIAQYCTTGAESPPPKSGGHLVAMGTIPHTAKEVGCMEIKSWKYDIDPIDVEDQLYNVHASKYKVKLHKGREKTLTGISLRAKWITLNRKCTSIAGAHTN